MFNITKPTATISPEQMRSIAVALMGAADEQDRVNAVINEAVAQVNNGVAALKSIGAIKK